MIKPPGIIDNTIELPGRCYAIRMMPHEVDIADIHDWDQAYVDAMKLIVDGNVDEGKEILEELYRRKYNRAGHTLSYGYGAGWFGEPDSKKYLSLVYALVLKGYSAAFSDYGFCYDCGIWVKKSMRWALYWYRKAADLGVTAAIVNLVMCKKLVASVDRFDKVVPLTEFLGEDNLSGKPLLVRFVNRSLDVISF